MLMPYLSLRPPSQSRRPLQSGAAARTTDLPLRSDRVETLLSSAYFLETKNALLSVAAEGSSSVIPAFFSSGWASAIDCVGVGEGHRRGVAAVVGAVEELEDAADVLGNDVDALGEHLHVDVAGADELHLRGVARLLQHAGVEVGDDLGLGEVLARDRTTPRPRRTASYRVSAAVVLLSELPRSRRAGRRRPSRLPRRGNACSFALTFCVPRLRRACPVPLFVRGQEVAIIPQRWGGRERPSG